MSAVSSVDAWGPARRSPLNWMILPPYHCCMRTAAFTLLALAVLSGPLVHGAHVLAVDGAAAVTCFHETAGPAEFNPAQSCCHASRTEQATHSCCSVRPDSAQAVHSEDCSKTSGDHCCSCCQDGCHRIATGSAPMWFTSTVPAFVVEPAGLISLLNDARVVRAELPEIPPPKA